MSRTTLCFFAIAAVLLGAGILQGFFHIGSPIASAIWRWKSA